MATSTSSYLSLSAVAPTNGVPHCWDWEAREVLQYIHTFRNQTAQAYSAEGHNISSFNLVVDEVLIKCLMNGAPYYRDDKLASAIMAPFHRCRAVPITDVFGALGWFISYSEKLDSDLSKSITVHIIYTRLCLNIGREMNKEIRKKGSRFRINTVPAMTHMLIVGSWLLLQTEDSDLQRVTGDMALSHSFSSSLPRDYNETDTDEDNAKTFSKNKRIQLLRSVLGENAIRGLNSNNVGNCAETLNVASQHPENSNTRTIGSGHALRIQDVDIDTFTSFNDLRTRAYNEACYSCRAIFRNGRLTQQDIGSGDILGPIPTGFQLNEDYSVRNPRPLFRNFVTPPPLGESGGNYIPALAGYPVVPVENYQSYPGQGFPYMPNSNNPRSARRM